MVVLLAFLMRETKPSPRIISAYAIGSHIAVCAIRDETSYQYLEQVLRQGLAA